MGAGPRMDELEDELESHPAIIRRSSVAIDKIQPVPAKSLKWQKENINQKVKPFFHHLLTRPPDVSLLLARFCGNGLLKWGWSNA
jgi:hypothetical protein